MRIGFQIEHLDPARGGAETYVDTFARRLIACGHEVHVFAGGFNGAPPELRTHVMPHWSPEAAKAAADAEKLDVVVGVGKSLGMNVFQPHGGTFFGSRRQNLALIRNPVNRWLRAAFNHIIPKHRAAARLEREQYAQAAPRPQFVAISQMVRRDMEQFHQVPADRVHLIYNGVDTDAYSPQRCADLRNEARRAWGLGAGTVCFVLVAHNFRLKGVRELIEAADRVRRRDRDFRVVVVGKGSPRPYVNLARKLGCADCIQFAGAMRDVLPAYAAADVYVQPTWYDPCSLVVLEAWACGLPVITTRFNGAGELMTGSGGPEAGPCSNCGYDLRTLAVDKGCPECGHPIAQSVRSGASNGEGFLIDTPADTDALAARMIELLDADLRAVIAPAARALAERHTLDHNFREMTAVFERAAAER